MITNRQGPFSEYYYIHVQRFEVGGAIWILIEAAKTDEVVVAKQFNLLARFFHLDIFCRKGMDVEDLARV